MKITMVGIGRNTSKPYLPHCTCRQEAPLKKLVFPGALAQILCTTHLPKGTETLTDYRSLG